MKRLGLAIVCTALLCVVSGTMAQAAKPSRIASINLCTDQLLLELVPRERIAALSQLAADRNVSPVADRVGGLKLVQGGAEEVLLLNPDLVLASPFSATPTVNLLTRLGYRVELVPFGTDFDGIRGVVRQVARAVGEVEQGEAIIARFDAAIAPLTPDNTGSPKPEAIVYQLNGLVSGTGSLADAALRASGFANQAARHVLGSGVRLSLENLVALPPDLVVLAQRAHDYRTVVSDNLRHPALTRLIASSAALELPMPLWLCGTPHVAKAVQLLRDARQKLEPRPAQ